MTPDTNPPPPTTAMLDARLDEIERALKFDPDPSYRRQLIREYLQLTEPKKDAA